MADSLDTPRERRRLRMPHINLEGEGVGKAAEAIARFSGTPKFLVYLTVFIVVWIGWNSLPGLPHFDKPELGFTALTLMLSLQASYAAPLILLAQNRQDDRDRVTAEQDRRRAERNLSDTEYLLREIASLRAAMADVATRDFVRSELRDLLEEIVDQDSSTRRATVREAAEAIENDTASRGDDDRGSRR
ncbi:MAG: DUF1003 domain-containing protein [Actinomycetaceae bacterium]|nr:DUF1003 domain-containing protein [Actinomycetaceae bacterium]